MGRRVAGGEKESCSQVDQELGVCWIDSEETSGEVSSRQASEVVSGRQPGGVRGEE